MRTPARAGISSACMHPSSPASSPDRVALFSVVHRPNLNLLGSREVHIYGSTTLPDIDRTLADLAQELGHELETFQSNSEGALIDRVQSCRGRVAALLLNA